MCFVILGKNWKGGRNMSTVGTKKNRILEIFFRMMKGENISIKGLADEYGVSNKSISRDVGDIKNFLSENRDVVGNVELKYSTSTKGYHLEFDNFLLSKELIAIIKVLIGSRAFSKMEMIEMVSKLKQFISYNDENMLEKLIAKEMYHYNEVKHDCISVVDNIWQLTHCILEKIEISISYYKINRERVERRLSPVAILFSDFYFYLIAYRCDKEEGKFSYYRIDQIVNIVEHRKHFKLEKQHEFEEGIKIKFEYIGDSVQTILDKLPMARIVDKVDGVSIIEAQTHGKGVTMFLLSQGRRIKVIEPEEFVDEIRDEIKDMCELYE